MMQECLFIYTTFVDAQQHRQTPLAMYIHKHTHTQRILLVRNKIHKLVRLTCTTCFFQHAQHVFTNIL